MSYPYKSHQQKPHGENFAEKSQQSRIEPFNPFSPSKMQVGFPNPQVEEPSQTSRRRQPSLFQSSQRKVEFSIEETPSSQFQRSRKQPGFQPSQSQGNFPRSEMQGRSQREVPGQSQRNTMGQSQRNSMGQGHPNTLAAGHLNAPQIAPTVVADARPAGRSVVIRPGEPHHFGCSQDVTRGEYLNTLCRCNEPMSHGDAYTMCDSPRGFDINRQPIDWQTAKIRMLDLYGKDQISHQEEVAAIPYIFDPLTAASALWNEEGVKASIRAGLGVTINTAGNNLTWHNEDGHAKPHATADGLRTRVDRSGYPPPSGQIRRG